MNFIYHILGPQVSQEIIIHVTGVTVGLVDDVIRVIYNFLLLRITEVNYELDYKYFF
ncbi:MAG: hypothetical protein JGK26_06835 [Microcoleus sp. PH2017_27_LUM_O_A]|uniref:hypothetical protein n=1 Tax=unclassified Microcoleus TaxID=2642155 RepID=UPI001E112A83|nr:MULTISPECIES: hypothetical protein [unclassified Microcoleus]MCC3459493.1 hypothetical protein [Microcoleus sp. PH2017_11_PCY_U_A]MCC3477930.1 hypothetical protein [Microcoleus sp. PH2017_12_PCY_D_A]MCC3530312.1 hypothetical protein [Microcoleus sp. PH2017_21_RUC_O_A]MCC3542606.1 hypothetical protein [Microcoleus sp. PH2017_22_RUC_O_B]MCC3558846.1 hypothetical protein [Microcoleus sp. PH2017_27_LUM_O_A]